MLSDSAIEMSEQQLADTLRSAMNSGDIEVIHTLIAQGIDLRMDYQDEKRGVQGSLLHHFASLQHSTFNEKDTDIIALFLEHVPIDARNGEGQTPLHIAAGNKNDKAAHFAMARHFLQLGANVNACDKQMRTPLHAARRANLDEMANVLLSAGADATLRDQDGATADESWQKLTATKIARVTTEAALNYSLTEIFNFESRTYTCLSRNLASKAEALVVQPFSAVDEGDLLDRAFYALLHRGGSADHAPRSFKKSGLIPKNLKS